jgi:uncharacterized membrane-anchored protein YjiN (DUF445 family)
VNGNDVVQLREYIEALIKHERELRERTEAEYRRELKIQAAEYERRLENLNHENTRVQALGNEMLSKQEHHQYVENQRKWEANNNVWKENIDKSLNTMRGVLLFVAFVVPIVSLVIKWVN